MESWKNYEHERDAPMIARYCKWDWFFVRIIDRKVWWKYLPHYCHRHCKCYNHTHWMLLGLGIEPTKASDRQKQLWSNLSSSMPFLSEQRGSPTVTISLFPCACGCCAPGYTDTCFSFSFSYAHGRYALIGRFALRQSRDPGRFRVTWFRICLFVRFPFPSHVTVTIYAWVMAARLDSSFVMLTLSRLCFLLIFGYVDSSWPGLRYAHVLPERFVSCLYRFFLHPVFYPTSYPYPTGRYSCLVRLRPLRLFVLVSLRLVYILGWRWDDPHLQSTLQPPWSCDLRDPTYSLSTALVRWPRLLASRILGSSPLSTRLPVVKSSLRSVLRCARNRRLKINPGPSVILH